MSFSLSIARAGVEPVFKQLKDPNLDGENNDPSTSGIAITPDGKKMFVMDNLEANAVGGQIYIYDLTTAFDISTMDVPNRTIVTTAGLGDNLGFGNGKKTIAFNNDGKKLFLFNSHGTAQFHNLASPYDVASISASTLIPDDGLNYKSAYNSGALEINALYGFAFNNDGTRMYLNDGTKNTTDITQVNLSTPFDPSSGTFAFNLNTEDIPDLRVNGFTFEIAFDDDGTRLYISEGLNNSTAVPTFMFVYKLSTPFELSSATYVGASQIVGNGNNVSAIGWTFGNNGMKAYIGTEDANDDGDDIIYEYDLTCPYGIVICENETASVIGAQVEIAKNVIHQNTSTIFKRFEWLRKNDNRTDFNSHNINLNINNPILASLKTKLQTSFKDTQYVQASIKKSKLPGNKNNWSHWSHGDISFGRVGETLSLKAKDIKTKGIMIGADKKMINNRIFGLALRYGNDDIDIKSFGGEELNSQALSLNIYGSLPVNDKSNLNALLGASFLSIDQLISGATTGERNGRQVFTSFSYETEQNYTKYDLIPYGKAEMGVTQFSDYTDYGTASTNSVETHERLTFRTGNVSTGFKFDSILYMEDGQISRNGFLEYVADLTSDIDHYYKNHIDNVTLKNSIKRYSKSNIKGNIGFEFIKKDGHTIAINYERFQSLSNSGHTDSLLFKFGKKQNESTNFNAVYDPTHNNRAEINYLKELEKFNLKLSSNYSLFSKIPDYGANIQISGNF
tara:strand:- start:175 stop:2376 length:2202 start_codon:yes stop_codon:yes gene_type:complete